MTCARLRATHKFNEGDTMSAMPESFVGAAANDADAQETREWLDALSAVVGSEGNERAHFLLDTLIDHARQAGIDVPFSATTAYVNTIPVDQEERCPGNLEVEERLRAYMRWNAMAMVVKANRLHPEDGGDLGGHISSFASVRRMFGAAFNPSCHAESEGHGGDRLSIRGNSSPGIQELEGEFRGSGWNVIKLLWGSYWDPLLARDKEEILRKVMMDTVDGDYQAMKANDGAFVRKHFFGQHPKLLEMVSKMSDDDIWRLNRGGHDPQKVYAAYHRAVNHKGQPTVLLIKTVKGFGMGKSGEGKMTAHQTKKLTDDDIKSFRDRFNIPVNDEQIATGIPFYNPADETPEMKYLHERRKALGGYLPKRRTKADEQFKVPELETFKAVLEPTAEGREISTTQAYVRFLSQLLRDKALGPRAVPILVDEARTFGMEGLFRQIGIYNPEGQKYTPVDKDQVMYYKEDAQGQILQEGINEAGGMSSWIAAATSYSTNNRIMVPFYIYYSMFGLQRVGDLAWAAGDMQARGFLLGGTSGRTTLNGEGLQHEDGHSHILAGTIPNCISYDPTFAHEVGVILHHGLKRMVEKQDNVYFYLTLLNENYAMPGLRAGTEEQIIKGMYLLEE